VANLQFSVLSDKCLRDINEDAYCAERMGNYYILAVADGLGGHAAGEVASAIAISALKDAMRDCDSPKIALENGVLTSDEQIHAQSEQYEERRGMATTLIAACVDDDLNCTVINVGDSRAHIITAEGIKTTKDHSLVNKLIDAGEITPEEAWQHPLLNVLSQALGDRQSVIKPDFYEMNLRDTFLLLSSDGLHDYIRKERIREIVLANGEDMEKSCKDLVEEALSSGSADNITVVLAHGRM